VDDDDDDHRTGSLMREETAAVAPVVLMLVEEEEDDVDTTEDRRGGTNGGGSVATSRMGDEASEAGADAAVRAESGTVGVEVPLPLLLCDWLASSAWMMPWLGCAPVSSLST